MSTTREALEPTGIIDGSVVQVFLAGTLAGSARFVGSRLGDYRGQPLGATPEAHEAALDGLAERLLAQGRAELSAMQREAYDDDGVDMSLIRWMLSLSPRERLRVLDERARFIEQGRAAMRNAGILVPERVE